MKDLTLKKIYSGTNADIESFEKAKMWVLENLREIIENSEKAPENVQINIAEQTSCCCYIPENGKENPPPMYYASIRVEIENDGK